MLHDIHVHDEMYYTMYMYMYMPVAICTAMNSDILYMLYKHVPLYHACTMYMHVYMYMYSVHDSTSTMSCTCTCTLYMMYMYMYTVHDVHVHCTHCTCTYREQSVSPEGAHFLWKRVVSGVVVLCCVVLYCVALLSCMFIMYMYVVHCACCISCTCTCTCILCMLYISMSCICVFACIHVHLPVHNVGILYTMYMYTHVCEFSIHNKCTVFTSVGSIQGCSTSLVVWKCCNCYLPQVFTGYVHLWSSQLHNKIIQWLLVY